MGVLLARSLGVAGYGTYSYAMSWLALLSIPASVGFDRLLVRLIASYQVKAEWGLMRGVLRWTNLLVLAASLFLLLSAAGIAFLITSPADPQLLNTFLIALLLLPLMTLSDLRQAALQGLHKVLAGQLPEAIIRPVLIIALIACAGYLGGGLNAPRAAGINLAATFVAFVIGTKLLKESLPHALKESSPLYRMRPWMSEALPLLLLSGLRMVYYQTDTLMLGMLKGVEAVGIFAVANRAAELISFALVAVNMPLAPITADLWTRKERGRLQRAVTFGTRASFLLALLIGLVLLIWGQWFLAFFGTGFVKAQSVLTILSVGQLANAFMGPVGVLLIMTGHHREAAIGLAAGVAFKLLLSALLIPRWGAEGAAVARTCGLVAWNVLLAFWVYRRLGINATFLGRAR
jgi:O-antigen/teichoic acid export membrane protein